jgi:hypothetical protein
MTPANDNNRHEICDDFGFEILKLEGDMEFIRMLRKLTPMAFIESHNRTLSNFLWFTRFSYEYKKADIVARREKIKVLRQKIKGVDAGET